MNREECKFKDTYIMMYGIRGNGEKEADIKYLTHKLNQFCERYYGWELTPDLLTKFENLLRYGEIDYEKYKIE